MAPSCLSCLTVLLLAFGTPHPQAPAQAGRTPPATLTGPASAYSLTLALSDVPANTTRSVCAVYPLKSFGDDPNLGKWVAETIPQVIRPETWDQMPDKAGQGRKLSYYAPGRVLVVYHTPAVQAEVAAFLQQLQKALPQEKGWAAARAAGQNVVPARYSVPSLIPAAEAAPAGSPNYPVPAPAKQPKHLFHFIIHYDGEGVVDPAVTGLIKEYTGTSGDKDDKAKTDSSPTAQGHQSFNFIIRYEGEGIIDSTVADVLKTIYGSGEPIGGRWNVPPCTPAAPAACAPALSGSAAPGGSVTGSSPTSGGFNTTPPPQPEVLPPPRSRPKSHRSAPTSTSY